MRYAGIANRYWMQRSCMYVVSERSSGRGGFSDLWPQKLTSCLSHLASETKLVRSILSSFSEGGLEPS